MGTVFLAFFLLLGLIMIGFPIFIAILIVSILFTLILGIPLSLVPTKIFGGIDSFTLMAIPFFILAGNIMAKSKVTDRIVDFSKVLVGHLPGGLGHVNILSSMIFAGIQGSGVADASAIGSIMIPAMIRDGYDRDYSVAVTASSSVIGPIIPPSIAMIMYGYYTGLSVGRLFLGGLVPGILIGVGLMIVNHFMFKIRGYTFVEEKAPLKKILLVTYKSIGALIMPLIIILGIVGGIFSPTEAGIAASVYGLLYGTITRELKWKDLPKVFVDSAKTTASVMIIIAVTGIFSNILTRLQFQRIVIESISYISNPFLATLAMMGIIILLGCFLDPTVLIVMFGGLVAGLGNTLGFDPIHYGVLMIITMLTGALTPPVGSMLFISCGLADLPVEKSIRALLPYLIVIFLVIVAILFIPGLVLWVNQLAFG